MDTKYGCQVAIQSDYLDRAHVLFEELGYRLVEESKTIPHSALAEELNRPTESKNIVRKAVFLNKGWTHIYDPELVLMFDGVPWCQLTKDLQTRVVCWMVEARTGTVGFSLYENGERIREVIHYDSESEEDGSRLLEEAGIDWKSASEEDVFAVVTNLGVDSDPFGEDLTYHTYLLDESEMETENEDDPETG